jgi:hypothetical protein
VLHTGYHTRCIAPAWLLVLIDLLEGVDYFVESHLGKLMMYLAHRIKVSVQSSIRHDTDNYVFDSRYDAKGKAT